MNALALCGCVLALAFAYPAADAKSVMPTATVPRQIVVPFDAKHSHVRFKVNILGLFTKRGEFVDFEGALEINEVTQKARVHTTIRANSASMRAKADAELLRRPAYFAAERFPEVRFRSKLFPLKLLRSGGAINGYLELRGHRLSQAFALLPGACEPASKPPWECNFSVVGKIARSRFGMRARRGVVSDEVELEILVVRATSPN